MLNGQGNAIPNISNLAVTNTTGTASTSSANFVYDSQFLTSGVERPMSVAVDNVGNVYVGNDNDVIRKYASSGVSQLSFGSTGQHAGEFNGLYGLAVDENGNIYVADYANSRIQKFSSSGAYLFSINNIVNPAGIVLDSSGNIYVFGDLLTKYNSTGVLQWQTGSNGIANGQFRTLFSKQKGVALDSAGNVYVIDTFNQRVQKFNSSGVYQSQFGNFGYNVGQFILPDSIVISSTTGNIYVGDILRNDIQEFNSSGVFQSKFGSYAVGIGGSNTGYFNEVHGLAMSSDGGIYVADIGNRRIQKFVSTTTTSDITAPVISTIASSTSQTSATITWTTDEVSDSLVSFGTTASYGTASSSATLTTSHSIVLSSLTAGTLYHFKISSTDGSSNLASSSDLTFTTTILPDTTAPVISSIASSTTSSSATITWTTNENGTSLVDFGTTSSYGTASSSASVTSHSVVLSGLTASTLYHFRITSADASNNTATSSDLTFTTNVDTNPPTFTIQFYSDSNLTATISDNAKLKAGTYFLKITANKALSASPTVSINAEGTANDVTNATMTSVGGNVYKYAYVISSDSAAVGATIADFSVTGTDTTSHTSTNVSPTDEAVKAIYTDTVAPLYQSSAVNGSTLTLTYNEALDAASVPATSTFAVLVDGATTTISSVSISGSTVLATLSSGVANGQTVTMAYTASSTPIRDSATNNAISLTSQSVTNNTAAVSSGSTGGQQTGGGGGGGGGGSSAGIIYYNRGTTTTATTTGSIGTILTTTPKTTSAPVASPASLSTGSISTPSTLTLVQINTLSKAPTLKVGTRSSKVVLLQKYLNSKGFSIASNGLGSKGKESTYFGVQTKQALMKFQKAAGIEPDGRFGPITKKFISKHP